MTDTNMTQQDRKNVFTLMDDGFGEEYKDSLVQQRIREARERLGLTEPNQVAPSEPTQEAPTQEAPTQEKPKEDGEDPERGLLSSVGAFLKELPEQAIGGVFDAVNQAASASESIGKAVGIPNYGIQLTDKDGNFDLKFMTPEEMEESGGMKIAPKMNEAETVAGDFTRTLASFAAGFIPASSGLKALGVAGGIGRGMAAGGAADAITMDPHQDRLATLLNEVPVLQDVIPDYMADNDPANESEWEGRIKNVLEGVVIGGATEGIIKGATGLFKSYKAAKMAPKVAKTPEVIAKETETAAAAKASALDDLVQETPVDLGPEELLTKTPEGKTYFNSNRVKSADDIKKVLQNMADETDLSDTTKTLGEMKQASKAEYKEVADLLGREPNRPFTASEAVAARDLMTSSAENLSAMAKAASDPMASPEQLFQFRRAMEVHKSVQEVVLAGRKATAQSLKSWDIPSAASKQRSKQISELMMTRGQDAKKMAEMIADIADNGGNVSAAVQPSLAKKAADSYYQVWINGLLSSPSTHAVNITSNVGTAMFSIPERYINAGFDAMRGAGGESLAAANGRAVGFFGGLRDGFELMIGKNKNAELETIGKMEKPTDAISAAAWGKRPDSTVGMGLDYLGKAINLPGWALEKGDLFFKGIGYRMKIQEQAYQTAYQEGLKGKAFKERVADFLKNPPTDAADSAVDFARYQTFTNEPGQFAKKMGALAHSTPGARYIVPFMKTPANILSYGFERTPLAPLMGDVRRKLMAGGAEAAEAASRMAAGGLLMASVVPLTLDGKITGAGPADWNKRRALEATGWKPYSVKIGDKYVSYDRLEPISSLVGYAADIASIMGQLDEEESGELVAAGLAAFSRNYTNKTFLSGISEFASTVTSGSPNKWENYSSRMLAGFIQPVYSSAGRRAANYFNPVKEDFRADEVNGFLKSTMMRAMSTVPGFGSDAPPLRDVWGEEMKHFTSVAPALEAVSPIVIHEGKDDPVSNIIAENDIALTLPSRNVAGVKLTNKEYSRYSELAGKAAKKQLDRLYKNGVFKNASGGPDGTASLIVKRVITKSRGFAKGKLMREIPDFQDRVYNARKEKQAKLIGG